jgi:Tol biopolymer transport system component
MTTQHHPARLRPQASTGRRGRSAGLAALALAATAAVAASGAAPAYAATTHGNRQVVLANVTDAQADAKSAMNGTAQVASYDGTSVVFSTTAALVPEDTNGVDDVYLRSQSDATTILVSRKGTTIGDDSSFEPTISDDGRYVAFTTFATNLVRDRNGGTLDVVVHDMYTGKNRLVSVGNDGIQSAKGNSFFPVISGNGKAVSFQTFGRFGRHDTDRREDVYVRDLVRGRTAQVSLTPSGADVKPAVVNGDVSDDGRLVVFGENNSLWVRNVARGVTTRFWHEPDAPPCSGFPAGSAGRPVISGNGAYVAFSSCATKLPGPATHAQVYRMKLASGAIRLVSRTSAGAGNADAYLPSLSRSGRFVGFGSDAADLAPPTGGDAGGDPDAFVADLKQATLTRVSQAADGTESNNWSASTGAALSGDGRTLVYESYATNLVAGDLYDWEEVFAWHR